jgi:hypothetical protein
VDVSGAPPRPTSWLNHYYLSERAFTERDIIPIWSLGLITFGGTLQEQIIITIITKVRVSQSKDHGSVPNWFVGEPFR